MQNRNSPAKQVRRAPVKRAPVSLKKRIKTALALITLGVLGVVAILGIYAIIVFLQVRSTMPSLKDLGSFGPDDATTFYYADTDATGKPLVMATLATEDRKPVKLEEIADVLKDATVSAEDARFFEHRGVDLMGIARAFYRNVAGGDLRGQGGSTITQQLARNISSLGLTKEKKFKRKVAEAILAIQIEQSLNKNEILELYLNSIYYGHGAYGIEAASRFYFHKGAKDLDLAQAALLAGIPQRPALYSVKAKAAQKRRDWVLERMVTTGKITNEQRLAALSTKVRIPRNETDRARVNGAPYFVNYVKAEIARRYGPDAVYRGWKVYTTLDSRAQAEAERCLREGVDGTDANQACLIALDNKSGGVRAMVGGLDYRLDQFNIASSGTRQPGSSFKPIVYAAAIDSGKCTLESTYRDDPDFPWKGRDKWTPKNYNGKYSYSSVTVLSAIKHSLNTIAVRAAIDVGLDVVVEYAKRLGITTELEAYPPLALGASAVHPIELCSAYSAFANEGKRAHPHGIDRIVDREGGLIEETGADLVETRIQPSTCVSISDALREVVQSGTGTAAAAVPNAHGKTGTTSDNMDAWFAGFTPELTTVVWVAHERRDRTRRVVGYDEMPGATGGKRCAPIWREFMLKAVPFNQDLAKRGGTVPALPPSEEAPADPEAAGRDVQRPGSPDAATPDAVPDASPSADGTEPSRTEPVDPPTETTPQTPTTPTETRTVPPPSASTDETVSVRLCADTMLVAGAYCPTTVERRLRRRDMPRRCREHRAPQGAEAIP